MKQRYNDSNCEVAAINVHEIGRSSLPSKDMEINEGYTGGLSTEVLENTGGSKFVTGGFLDRMAGKGSAKLEVGIGANVGAIKEDDIERDSMPSIMEGLALALVVTVSTQFSSSTSTNSLKNFYIQFSILVRPNFCFILRKREFI